MEKLPFLLTLLPILLLQTWEIIHSGNAHLVDCQESDRKALIDFKNGLKDPQNRLSSWHGGNCCQWMGIGCDNNTGAVITLDLRNPHPSDSSFPVRYELGGEIRPSLANLKSLRYLDLSFNGFNGTPIPTFLQSLQKLRYLNLAYAEFGGIVPPQLGNISSLQYLDVSSYLLAVSNLEWLSNLGSLKYLALNGVDLSMIQKDLAGVLNMLPNLTELHLADGNMNGSVSFLNLANFSSLAVIALSHNDLCSEFPNWLVNISSLVSFDVSDCRLHGSIPLGFSELPNLLSFYVANNDLTANTYELLQGSWNKVEFLNFQGNDLHGKLPSCIGNITSLSYLDLSDNNIRGEIPSSFAKLCHLQYLDLASNNITGSLLDTVGGTENCLSERPFPSLEYLSLGNNKLSGKLPNWLGEVQTLVELSLENNMFYGSIPASFGKLGRLETLSLNYNELNGTLPDCLGQLSELYVLDVSFNHLIGLVSESHFSKLTKLNILSLSSNSFILKVSSAWVPPFQVEVLEMGSCYLGPLFPAWIKSQRVAYLDFSNSSISDFIPSWFWDISGNLSVFNFSFNQLKGQLPNSLKVYEQGYVDLSFNLLEGPIPLPSNEVAILNLSHNKFSGHIPENIGDLSFLSFLSLANNQISGEIPSSIGKLRLGRVIDLSWNNLTGRIPTSIGNCYFLEVLDLQNNKLSGNIPKSLGQLSNLQTLHLRNNMIRGKLPSSFRGLLSLETLDLGYNRLTGKIPQWLGDAFPCLKILSLRSNAFSGEVPSGLFNLSSLQVLDLAENQLRGSISTRVSNLKGMTEERRIKQELSYGWVAGVYYQENLVVNSKGQSLKYTRTLSFLTCIDISGNHLHGELPHEVTELAGLVVLNLSRNYISGQIPETISELHQLASLDLSSNMFFGPIPPSMISMSFLAYLNFSYNDLLGKIPYAGQMTTFEANSFAGNPGLCGAPLVVRCSGSDTINKEMENAYVYTNDRWPYLAIGLGYAAGLLIPYLLMAAKRSWSFVYFAFVDKTVDALLYLACKRTACFGNHCDTLH